MTQNNAPRLLLAGTGSGCGKTTVTTAILRALQRRGVTLSAFKCGPDYIDPMFHTAVLGVPSRNLDLFFEDEAGIRSQLARHIQPDGLGVIEGVMGFYDGVSGTTDTASAAHLARATGTPAVLIVRPKGQSLSLAAQIHGVPHICGKYARRSDFERRFGGNVLVLQTNRRESGAACARLFAARFRRPKYLIATSVW